MTEQGEDAANTRRAASRHRSLILGCCLGGLVLLVYLVTLVRLVRP